MRKAWLVALVLVAMVVVVESQTGGMTLSQLQTLKADIATPCSGLQDQECADLYNANASPDFWVWRTFVADSELYEATSSDATTWSWTIFIARSQAERDAWRQMVNMKGGIAPHLPNVRAGIADIFSGAGGANQRTHLLAIGRRLATRCEKLLATGAGSTASPATMGFEGKVTAAHISEARNLP